MVCTGTSSVYTMPRTAVASMAYSHVLAQYTVKFCLYCFIVLLEYSVLDYMVRNETHARSGYAVPVPGTVFGRSVGASQSLLRVSTP